MEPPNGAPKRLGDQNGVGKLPIQITVNLQAAASAADLQNPMI